MDQSTTQNPYFEKKNSKQSGPSTFNKVSSRFYITEEIETDKLALPSHDEDIPTPLLKRDNRKVVNLNLSQVQEKSSSSDNLTKSKDNGNKEFSFKEISTQFNPSVKSKKADESIEKE